MSSDALARGRAATTPLIDPRLRDRRIEVARDQGRRRLRRAIWVVALLVLVAGVVAATRSPLLDVDRIAVRGAEGPRADQVRAASGIEVGEPLVDVDAGAAVRRIEAVPWVADASVERRWPDGVAVRVEVRSPVAVVGEGADAVLVDGDGRAIDLAPSSGSGADLPVVEGAAPAVGGSLAGDARVAAGIIAALPEDLRAEVASAGGPSSDVELELRDGIVVAWGDAAQPSAKAEALGVLLGQDDRASFSRIDVSVPRASTVTFRSAAGE